MNLFYNLLMLNWVKFSFYWKWREIISDNLTFSSVQTSGNQTGVPISNLSSLWQCFLCTFCQSMSNTVSQYSSNYQILSFFPAWACGSRSDFLFKSVITNKIPPFLPFLPIQTLFHLSQAALLAIFSRNKSSHNLWMMLFRFSLVELQLRKSSALTRGASILK